MVQHLAHETAILALPMLVIAFYGYVFCKYLYKRTAPSLSNVRGPPSSNFFTGNVLELISDEGYSFHMDLAKNYGAVVKLHALLGAKQLYVFDNAAMNAIFVQDEAIWDMPDALLAANSVIFGPCLVSTSGYRHKRARKILNPVFSPSRLRAMLPIMYGIASTMEKNTIASMPTGSSEIDMLSVLGTTALEFIGQAGLGHSFAADTEPDTLIGMKRLLFAAKRLMVPMQLLPLLRAVAPPALLRALTHITPIPALHEAQGLVDILDAKSQKILHMKREAMTRGDAAVLEQVGHGKDLMSLIMRANSKIDASERLPDAELLGQMNVFLFAGTDTTSTAMSRALQELALNPELQDRLRNEITDATTHGDLDYDQLLALPLMDAVFRETLRMYPPAVTASRQARRDTILPLTNPMVGVDGSIINELFIPKDTIVHAALKAANQNPLVWGADASQWNPDRWLHPLPKTVVDAHIPGVFPKLMSFIGGPRGCIGFKFAEMTMKILLSVLIKRFEFSLSDKEIIWKVGVAEAPTVCGTHALPLVVRIRD